MTKKRIVSVNVGIGNKIVNNEVTVTRQDFEITQEWFQNIFQKHFTSDIKSKYEHDLFIDQGAADQILSFITLPDLRYTYYLQELRILKDWINDFIKYYNELNFSLSQENIAVNEESRQYYQLEKLLSNSQSYLEQIKTYKEIIESKKIAEINNLTPFINTDLEFVRSFQVDKIGEYLTQDTYISEPPEEPIKVTIVFRRLSEIITQLKTINTLLDFSKNNIQFIHGNAGMGKSNLSAFLLTELKKQEFPVIFIKARSFNGDPDKFDEILMNQLEVPNNYQLAEVLKKMNDFGKDVQKKVTIIIDGLNETSFQNNGFSPIWKNSLDGFVEQIRRYPYLNLIVTLRTSYIERIWSDNRIPYKQDELSGFNDNDNLIEAVQRYFEHYKIKFESPDEADIFYFRTPLLLDLYCKMLNSDRLTEIDPIFGLEGFKTVFDQYISNLSLKIKTDLGLASSELVMNGIGRCSDEMLKNLGAFLPTLDYYNSMEGVAVTTIDDIFSHKVLEEYLIYLKDSFNQKDVVVHTQQEVGGYLLSKQLLAQFNNDIKELVKDIFFLDHIVGTETDQHQLAHDILKFLIVLSGEYKFIIEEFADRPVVKDYLWIKLQREGITELNIELREILSDSLKDYEDVVKLLEIAKPRLINLESPLNFLFVKDKVLKLSGLNFDLTWTKFIYENWGSFSEFIENFRVEVNQENFELNDDGTHLLKLDLVIWLQETTFKKLRDEATKLLLDFSSKFPAFIFEKVIEYSAYNRPYIYERLIGVCYGVCLRKQNDDEFIQNVLKKYIIDLYSLQFDPEPIAPTYNYLVIDNLKHIIDLAIYKKVFELNETELRQLNNYNFTTSKEWETINQEDKNAVVGIVSKWSISGNPDPLRGDFVHYTIPRLVKERPDSLEATAQIYKRLLKLGYESKSRSVQTKEDSFYFGSSLIGVDEKVDRLGKKYSWMAFYDYAGYLLNKGELDVWHEGDSSISEHYQRLSDVKIEVSSPKQNIYTDEIFKDSLLKHRTNDPNWTKKEMYELSKSIWQHQFKEDNFTLVYGYLEEKPDSTYDVRSYLLIDSFLVKKSGIQGKEDKITGRNMDWNDDIHARGSISRSYFGELYWADTIPDVKFNTNNIPTEETYEIDFEEIRTELSMIERLYEQEQKANGPEVRHVNLSLEIEPTVFDYLWESDSKIYPTLSDFIPSPNIGKFLNLKSDPLHCLILDEYNKTTFTTVDFEEEMLRKQNLNYFRTDLLKKYMEENDLVLMYQIKQHTYDRKAGDGSGDYRGMQFFFPHLEE